MYAVVGCRECSNLWVVEGRPKTTQCPRCGHRRAWEKLKKFVTTEDKAHAVEVRASMLANRSGHGEAFAEMDSFDALESQAEEAVVSDDEYLEGSGLDADAVAAAGERAGSGGGGSRSRTETVKDAVRELDEPTADAVAAYCEEHGVDGGWAREALERFARRGEMTESRGVYRVL